LASSQHPQVRFGATGPHVGVLTSRNAERKVKRQISNVAL
jgi:hypothetical protein